MAEQGEGAVRRLVRAVSGRAFALQEKQSHAFKLATQNGDPGKTDSITVIKREHDKFNPPCPHLFVFITDKRVGDDVKAQLDKCELVIDARNEQQFYGPFLARLKLFHDRNENVELDDPTEALRSSTGALRSWLASRSGSSTACGYCCIRGCFGFC